MSHLNTSLQLAVSLSRLPITSLRLALALALTILAQGTMAQSNTPAPEKPRAASVDRVDVRPATSPGSTPKRAPEPKVEVRSPSPEPPAVAQAPEVPLTPEALMPMPAEGRGTHARKRARPNAPAERGTLVKAPVTPAPEVQQP
jgi:hypothetical protein